jgi:hypothetical protein
MVFGFLGRSGQCILILHLRINLLLILINGVKSIIFFHIVEIVDLREILLLEHDGIDVEVSLMTEGQSQVGADIVDGA